MERGIVEKETDGGQGEWSGREGEKITRDGVEKDNGDTNEKEETFDRILSILRWEDGVNGHRRCASIRDIRYGDYE